MTRETIQATADMMVQVAITCLTYPERATIARIKAAECAIQLGELVGCVPDAEMAQRLREAAHVHSHASPALAAYMTIIANDMDGARGVLRPQAVASTPVFQKPKWAEGKKYNAEQYH
jgi:hypothetical protein